MVVTRPKASYWYSVRWLFWSIDAVFLPAASYSNCSVAPSAYVMLLARLRSS